MREKIDLKKVSWKKSYVERLEIPYECFEKLSEYANEDEYRTELFEEMSIWLRVENFDIGLVTCSFVCAYENEPVVIAESMGFIEDCSVDEDIMRTAKDIMINSLNKGDNFDTFIDRVIEYCEKILLSE